MSVDEIFEGILTSLNEVQTQYQSTIEKKLKLQQDTEIHNLETKTKKLELKKAEMLYGNDEMLRALSDFTLQDLKTKEKGLKLSSLQADEEIAGLSGDMKALKGAAERQAAQYSAAVGAVDPELLQNTKITKGQKGFKLEYTGGAAKGLTPYQNRGIDMNKRQALEMIQTQKFINKWGELRPIRNMEEARARLGQMKVDIEDPEIKMALKQSWIPGFDPKLQTAIDGLRETQTDEAIKEAMLKKGYTDIEGYFD